MSDQGQVSDAAVPGPSRLGAAVGSTPSTWAGVYVLASVVGLVLIRRSFRRMA